MTHSPGDIKRLLDEVGAGPKRSLGQNFVADPNTVRRIARLAGIGPTSKVVEIGAGLGSLTLALAETGARVVAIETDRALVPVLGDVLGDRAELVVADARELVWGEVLDGGGWHLVANLPYNIATSLVLDVLDEVPQVDHLLVMVQREAGERLAASVDDPAYGAVSVRVALRGRARIVGVVPPSVFVPRPKVTSVLVAIDRVEGSHRPEVEPTLSDLLRAGFGQRRKMLRRSLAGRVTPADFEAADIDARDRPEDLDLEQWLRLATVVWQRDSG
jgi:16S rRNA (adenine1518-N6/adenine1519-N6)-dimethyltransferase